MPATLWRVSVETGQAVRVGPRESIRPVVSPDGRAVAHYWMTPEQWTLAITAIDSELPARTFPISRTHAERVIRWAPDGSGLAFVDAVGGVPNVWFQPLDGSPLRALTNLADGSMPTFDWSPDGTKLAWTRVTEVRDVVTIPLAPGPYQRALRARLHRFDAITQRIYPQITRIHADSHCVLYVTSVRIGNSRPARGEAARRERKPWR